LGFQIFANLDKNSIYLDSKQLFINKTSQILIETVQCYLELRKVKYPFVLVTNFVDVLKQLNCQFEHQQTPLYLYPEIVVEVKVGAQFLAVTSLVLQQFDAFQIFPEFVSLNCTQSRRSEQSVLLAHFCVLFKESMEELRICQHSFCDQIGKTENIFKVSDPSEQHFGVGPLPISLEGKS
jgi:hypothetical protein